jgi:hypothetical protein
MKKPAVEIPLPVPIALLITAQETVAIGLLVDISATKDRAIPIVPVLEKVRTFGVVALPASSIVGASEKAVLITTLVGVLTVPVAVVVAGCVSDRVVVD